MTITIENRTIEAESFEEALKMIKKEKRAAKKKTLTDSKNYEHARILSLSKLGRICNVVHNMGKGHHYYYCVLDNKLNRVDYEACFPKTIPSSFKYKHPRLLIDCSGELLAMYNTSHSGWETVGFCENQTAFVDCHFDIDKIFSA